MAEKFTFLNIITKFESQQDPFSHLLAYASSPRAVLYFLMFDFAVLTETLARVHESKSLNLQTFTIPHDTPVSSPYLANFRSHI